MDRVVLVDDPDSEIPGTAVRSNLVKLVVGEKMSGAMAEVKGRGMRGCKERIDDKAPNRRKGYGPAVRCRRRLDVGESRSGWDLVVGGLDETVGRHNDSGLRVQCGYGIRDQVISASRLETADALTDSFYEGEWCGR